MTEGKRVGIRNREEAAFLQNRGLEPEEQERGRAHRRAETAGHRGAKGVWNWRWDNKKPKAAPG